MAAGGITAMVQYRTDRGRRRGRSVLCGSCCAAALLLAGCSDFKQMIGLDPTMPDEFAVESRAPRTQEESTKQQAEQIMEQAGPGGPGTGEAADFRLRTSENGLPNLGGNSETPDPAGMVGSQSLSSKLLGYGDTGNAGVTVDKRETTPLKGVY